MKTDTGSDYVAAVQAEIRARMGRYQINQRELADRIGVTQNAVTRWLNGDRLDLQALIVLANALEVSIVDLISDAERNKEDLRSASNR